MNLLFVTRKYPPSVGGMENVCYALSQEFAKQVPTTVVAWGGSQMWLPYFAVKALAQSLWLIPAKRITHIHLGDGVLAPVGLALKLLTRRRVSVTLHGLEVTYPHWFYRALVLPPLRRLDHYICISDSTLREATQRGIPAAKCNVIPWGVYPEDFQMPEATRADLERIAGVSAQGKTVLLTVGRLVKRKGAAWFIREVMPQLGPNYLYLVVGEGSDRPNIEAAIAEHQLHDRVKLLGRLPDADRKVLYNTTDVFVMPNIPIPDDVEGFGIVAIEAAAAGLPVVASDLEGLRAAVIEGETGALVKPESTPAFTKAIAEIRAKLTRQKTQATVQKAFSWGSIIKKYMVVVA